MARMLISQLSSAGLKLHWQHCAVLQVDCHVWLHTATGEQALADGLRESKPSGGQAYAYDTVEDPASADGACMRWEAFWAPGSPYMHSGKARVRVELGMPEGH
jgi:hypothetical protein